MPPLLAALLPMRRHVFGMISRHSSTSVASTGTSVEKGLEYEHQVARVMAQYNCRLTPTSMSMDGGVDHYGVWALPGNDIQIVTQCVLSSQPDEVVGIFASASGYSVFAKRFFSRMTNPAIRVTIVQDDIVEFGMNPLARQRLPNLVPGTTFSSSGPSLVLMYDGRVLK
ncbi:hypothetical protein, variant [Aphanomyces invadans]|uniref:Restriction endonuclease type IV Mrr domain-containing protein n=1 Tax=Aphanomyces invadans TaxID=157072 RepID=A0A024UAS9_9STRA|nr:hypothetical protein, variant [Aphanomyces invadans]ETW03511.1 hypothetical protein, variant [Aphanomyces invadans]|eukprot:XP_008867740.1 hypothetical protein, variant [Aphanomyces invadans]